MAAGRPSKYNAKYHIPWARSLAMTGKTNEEIADAMGIARSTLQKWGLEHPEFSDTLKNGKGAADGKVVLALFERATGYEYEERKVVTEFDEAGQPVPVRIETTRKRTAPDTGAAMAWLKNRCPDEWRDAKRFEVADAREIDLSDVDEDMMRRLAYGGEDDADAT